MMILISDGRANVGFGGNIREELVAISEKTRQSGVHTVVIDTEEVEDSFANMKLGYCREIAEASGGRYFPISSLSPEALCRIVDGEQQQIFEKNT